MGWERFQPDSGENDIRATLAISPEEARTGTNRTLTLPGGQPVIVTVPSGSYDGQVIRLPGFASSPGTGSGDLLLTLAIQHMPAADIFPNSGNAEPTAWASYSDIQDMAPPPPPSNSWQAPPQAGPFAGQLSSFTPPYAVNQGLLTPPPTIPGRATRARPSTGKVILLAALALLIIAGGTGLFIVVRNNQVASDKANGTATAQAASTQAENATATTFSASTNATSTVIVRSTASLVANNPDPYAPGNSTLALYSPLADGNADPTWPSNPGSCTYSGGAYHVTTPKQPFFQECANTHVAFNNFAFEVQVTIIKGDAAGLAFRDDGNGNFYLFVIDRSGFYVLYKYANNSPKPALISGSNAAIHRGLNSAEIMAVVARGDTFTLYVDHQQIASGRDNTYNTAGSCGLVATSYTNNNQPAEAAFSNARAWSF
ncbi:MAG: hypothetical protein H0W02_05865 [Ktedonobacteraceae bacterium]|nr:hypothetical protein [Ktedonobacteraceae bacterium]